MKEEVKHLSEVINSIWYIDGPNSNQNFSRSKFRIKPSRSSERINIIYRERETWIYKEELDIILTYIKDINKLFILKYTMGLISPFDDTKFIGIAEDGYEVHLFYTED